jgi:hypothetical protein
MWFRTQLLEIMSYTIKKVYYFDAPGAQNTDDCVRCAIERAGELGLHTIVVASTSGETARKFLQGMQGTGLSLVVVSHVVGFSESGVWEFDARTAEMLRKAGARIVTGTHALSGLERSLSRSPRVGGGSRTEAVAEALRKVMTSGLKVAVECVLIATDQGVISPSEEVLAVGGTMSGADTVSVIRPSHTAAFFDLQVREIVAMPRNR